MILFHDTFTSATSKPLNEHVPEVGTWNEIFSSKHDFVIQGGTGTFSAATSSEGTIAFVSDEFKNPDYSITVNTGNYVSTGNNSRGIVLLGRYVDEKNYYGLEFLPSGLSPNLILFKVVNGTKTQLGSFNPVFIGTFSNSNKEFSLSFLGSTIQVHRDKQLVFSTVDTSIKIGGKVGFGSGILGFHSTGYNSGITFSDILVEATVTVPNAPSSLILTVQGPNSIRLNWQDASPNEEFFSVERSPNGTSSWQIINNNVPADTTEFVNSGLSANTTYFYRIRARNSAGNSSYSSVASATTSDNPPNAPANITTSSLSSSHVSLVWADNSTNETGFVLERGTGGIWHVIATLPANTTAYTDNAVVPATSYNYRIKAFNSGGDSDYSNQVSVPVPPLAPLAPSNLSVTNITSTSVTLSWSDNSTNEQGFRVERSTDSVSWVQTNQTGSNVTTATPTGLVANTTYFFRVKAFNNGGESSTSNVITVTTLRTAPVAPVITLTVVSAQQMRINWNTVPSATSYTLQRSLNNSVWSTVSSSIASSDTSFTDTGLSPSTLYFYRMQAVNNNSSSSFSNTVSGSTLANIGQSWFVGDAAFNSGKIGNGFLDIFSNRGLNKGTETGPTIIANRRFGNNPSEWIERASFGNLRGTFGYAADTFGIAAGTPAQAWFSVDETNGFRIMHNQTLLAQWNMQGTITIGQTGTNQANIQISSGSLMLRNGATNKIVLDSSGNALLTGQLLVSGGSIAILQDANNHIILGGTGIFATSGGIVQTSITMPDGKLRAGGNKVILDATGINIETGNAVQNSIKWNTTGGYNHALLYGHKMQTAFDGNASYLVLRAQNNETGEALTSLVLESFTHNQTERATIGLNTRKGIQSDSNLEVNLNGTIRLRLDSAGRINNTVPSGSRIVRTGTAMSIPNDSLTVLQFNSVINDTDDTFTTLQPTNFTVKRSGYYMAGCSLTLAAAGTTVSITNIFRHWLGIRRVPAGGGTPIILQSTENHTRPGLISTISVTTGMVWLNAGDVIQFLAYQNSGVALNTGIASGTEHNNFCGWFNRIA